MSLSLSELYLHELDEFLSNLTGIVGRLSDHELVLALGNKHVLCHQVLKNLIHVLNGGRVLNAAFLNWVAKDQVLGLLNSLLTDVPFFLVHADKHASVLGLAKHHGYEMLWRIILTETSLHVASADINNYGLVVVLHLYCNCKFKL